MPINKENSFFKKKNIFKINNIFRELKYQYLQGKKNTKKSIKILKKSVLPPLYKSKDLNKFIFILKNIF